MKKSNEIKRGDVITYTKRIMFKDSEDVKSKVVMVVGRKALLENGDEIFIA